MDLGEAESIDSVGQVTTFSLQLVNRGAMPEGIVVLPSYNPTLRPAIYCHDQLTPDPTGIAPHALLSK